MTETWWWPVGHMVWQHTLCKRQSYQWKLLFFSPAPAHLVLHELCRHIYFFTLGLYILTIHFVSHSFSLFVMGLDVTQILLLSLPLTTWHNMRQDEKNVKWNGMLHSRSTAFYFTQEIYIKVLVCCHLAQIYCFHCFHCKCKFLSIIYLCTLDDSWMLLVILGIRCGSGCLLRYFPAFFCVCLESVVHFTTALYSKHSLYIFVNSLRFFLKSASIPPCESVGTVKLLPALHAATTSDVRHARTHVSRSAMSILILLGAPPTASALLS